MKNAAFFAVILASLLSALWACGVKAPPLPPLAGAPEQSDNIRRRPRVVIPTPTATVVVAPSPSGVPSGVPSDD